MQDGDLQILREYLLPKLLSTSTLILNRPLLYFMISMLSEGSMETICQDCCSPQSSHCDQCGSALTTAQRHPGQGNNDPSYIVTLCNFQPVKVNVKTCTNKKCKDIHQVWAVEQGTLTSYWFNNNKKKKGEKSNEISVP